MTTSLRLFGPAELGTSATTILSGPCTCQLIRLVNTSGSARTFSFAIGADATGLRIYNTVTVPAGVGKTIKGPYTLGAQDFIQALASGSGVTCSIDGTEEVSTLPTIWTADGRVLSGTPTRSFLTSGDWYLENNRPGGDSNSGNKGLLLAARVANVNVSGSNYLRITAQREIPALHYSNTGPDDPYPSADYNYSTGALQFTTYSFLYGTVEARFKGTGLGGMSPALWLLGPNCQQTFKMFEDNSGACQWPDPGSDEIDYAEILTDGTTDINFQIHSGSNNDGGPVGVGYNLASQFTTVKMVWAAGSLNWYLNGSGTPAQTISGGAVPSTPMFAIIQTAVGLNGAPVNNPDFPNLLDVDYFSIT
jgi:hypothetical protein